MSTVKALDKLRLAILEFKKRSIIQYVRKLFRKINISSPLIRTRTSACQGVRNVRFSENFACALNERSSIKQIENHLGVILVSLEQIQLIDLVVLLLTLNKYLLTKFNLLDFCNKHNRKNSETCTPCSSVFIVNFEQVNAAWE